jgi:hypothetical protein
MGAGWRFPCRPGGDSGPIAHYGDCGGDFGPIAHPGRQVVSAQCVIGPEYSGPARHRAGRGGPVRHRVATSRAGTATGPGRDQPGDPGGTGVTAEPDRHRHRERPGTSHLHHRRAGRCRGRFAEVHWPGLRGGDVASCRTELTRLTRLTRLRSGPPARPDSGPMRRGAGRSVPMRHRLETVGWRAAEGTGDSNGIEQTLNEDERSGCLRSGVNHYYGLARHMSGDTPVPWRNAALR